MNLLGLGLAALAVGLLFRKTNPPADEFPGVVLVKPNVPSPVIPAGYRRMASNEVTPELSSRAQSLLGGDYGTTTPFTASDGRDVLAAVELHYHEPGGVLKPWGWHKGVSLFVRST